MKTGKKNRKKIKLRKLRHGLAATDVVFVIGTLFPMCMVLYYVAQHSLANLYELISVIIGCPVM